MWFDRVKPAKLGGLVFISHKPETAAQITLDFGDELDEEGTAVSLLGIHALPKLSYSSQKTTGWFTRLAKQRTLYSLRAPSSPAALS